MALDQSHEGTRTAPDHDEIVRHMQLYIDGFNQSDASKFRRRGRPDKPTRPPYCRASDLLC